MKFLLEFAVGLEAVRAHPKHHRIYFPEPRKRVAKIGRLLRSTGGVVLGIEEKNDILPCQGFASHDSSVVCLEREIWRPISLGDHPQLVTELRSTNVTAPSRRGIRAMSTGWVKTVKLAQPVPGEVERTAMAAPPHPSHETKWGKRYVSPYSLLTNTRS